MASHNSATLSFDYMGEDKRDNSSMAANDKTMVSQLEMFLLPQPQDIRQAQRHFYYHNWMGAAK